MQTLDTAARPHIQADVGEVPTLDTASRDSEAHIQADVGEVPTLDTASRDSEAHIQAKVPTFDTASRDSEAHIRADVREVPTLDTAARVDSGPRIQADVSKVTITRAISGHEEHFSFDETFIPFFLPGRVLHLQPQKRSR